MIWLQNYAYNYRLKFQFKKNWLYRGNYLNRWRHFIGCLLKILNLYKIQLVVIWSQFYLCYSHHSCYRRYNLFSLVRTFLYLKGLFLLFRYDLVVCTIGIFYLMCAYFFETAYQIFFVKSVSTFSNNPIIELCIVQFHSKWSQCKK